MIYDTIEESILQIFDCYAEPIKIYYKEVVAGIDAFHPSTTKELLVKDDSELILGFDIGANARRDDGLISEYDMELIIRNLKFKVDTVSFSIGVFGTILNESLVINGNTLDLSEVITIDDLLIEINSLTNIVGLKLSDTEFAILSTVDDRENDIEYKNLSISGTAQSILGLDTSANKASITIKINNTTYSVEEFDTGEYIKCLYLIRG